MGSGPRLQVAECVRNRVSPALLRAWMRRLTRAAHRLRVSPTRLGTLSVRVVGDAEMSELHLRHMNERGPTDVLSFPAEAIPGVPDDERPLGDLVVDWDAVVRQAAGAHHHAWLDEATALTVHGLVHLLGHDHRTRREARVMFRLERRASRSAGLPPARRPYAN